MVPPPVASSSGGRSGSGKQGKLSWLAKLQQKRQRLRDQTDASGGGAGDGCSLTSVLIDNLSSSSSLSHLPSPQLVLLDAGLTIELQPYDRQNLIALFKAVIENDGRKVARLMIEYAPPPQLKVRGGNNNNNNSSSKNSSSSSISKSTMTDTTASTVSVVEKFSSVRNPERYEQEMAELVDYVH